MTDAAPKISLNQQLEAVDFAVRRQTTLANGQTVNGLRGKSVEEHDLNRLRAAARTLVWLLKHEGEIKAFLALPEDTRKALLKHSHGGES